MLGIEAKLVGVKAEVKVFFAFTEVIRFPASFTIEELTELFRDGTCASLTVKLGQGDALVVTAQLASATPYDVTVVWIV